MGHLAGRWDTAATPQLPSLAMSSCSLESVQLQPQNHATWCMFEHSHQAGYKRLTESTRSVQASINKTRKKTRPEAETIRTAMQLKQKQVLKSPRSQLLTLLQISLP